MKALISASAGFLKKGAIKSAGKIKRSKPDATSPLQFTSAFVVTPAFPSFYPAPTQLYPALYLALLSPTTSPPSITMLATASAGETSVREAREDLAERMAQMKIRAKKALDSDECTFLTPEVCMLCVAQWRHHGEAGMSSWRGEGS